jgi:hypothetical protein
VEDYKSNSREEIYSAKVKAGKRTYFFDVKSTRSNDYYLTITESKKRFKDDGFTYEKHKIFLYKEDFDKFIEGLEDTINHIRQLQDTGDFRSSEFAESESEQSAVSSEYSEPEASKPSEESSSSASDISFDDL